MSLKHLLTIFLARWKSVSFFWVTIVAVVFGVSLILPPRYEAKVDVIVDVNKPDMVMGGYIPVGASSSYIATQMDIIKSRRVSDVVISNLHLDKNPQLASMWKRKTDGLGDYGEWLHQFLLDYMTVSASRESTKISIAYSSGDSNFAALMANAYADAYIATVLDMKVSPAGKNADWFKERLETLKKAVDTAQTALSDFRREKGLTGSSIARLDSENGRLENLTSQLALAQGQGAYAQSRRSNGGDLSALPAVLDNPLIQTIRAQIADVRARLQDASSRLGVNHPEYKKLTAQLAELNAQLDSQMERISSGLTVAGVQEEKKLYSLRKAVSDQRAQVIELNADMDRLSVLQHQLDGAEQEYQTISQRYLQTNLESQSTLTNISIVSAAVPPLNPQSPKLLLNTIMAIFLGGFISLAFALVFELTDRRLRDPSAFELASGMPLPLLGVIPPMSKKVTGTYLPVSARRKKQLAAPTGSGRLSHQP